MVENFDIKLKIIRMFNLLMNFYMRACVYIYVYMYMMIYNNNDKGYNTQI
jgi:phage shock protein PspC (stress-responsive transcriptional regulator)